MADCTLCENRWINGYMGCSRSDCNEYRLVTECNEWPVQLGLSIRRFLRRAEVKRLAREIRWHAYQMSSLDDEVCDDASNDLDLAISRLAALAMEGHSDE